MSQAHMNWETGKVCHCPYAQHAEADPSFQVREASNLDQLKSPKKRPDLQTPEGQEWLNYLDSLPPKTDAIAPWMTREWKQGRLLHDPGVLPHFPAQVFANDPNGSHSWDPDDNSAIPNEQSYYIPPGPSSYPVSPVDVNGMADWHHSNHPNKEGVNIQDKNFQVPQMLQKTQEYQDDLAAKQREGYGEVVHQFPDNWSIRRLQNAEECSDEGKSMGHCAASYGQKVEDQANLMYSLRDPKNNPHATFDVTPKSWRNLDTGEIEGGAPPGAGYGNYVPLPHQGTFNQAFGKEDAQPLPEYKDRIKQFMETMPEEERPTLKGTGMEGPRTPEALEDFSRDPEAWQRSGVKGAEEYGVKGQTVRPDYRDIMNNHYLNQILAPDSVDDGYRDFIYGYARQHGDIPELGQNVSQAYTYNKQLTLGSSQDALDTAHAGMQQLLQPHWNPETGQYQNEPYQAPQAPQPQTSFSSKQAAGLYLPQNWDQMFTDKLAPIAQAYDQAPTYDPAAQTAWHDLAQDSAERADQIRNQINVQETDDPEPYANAQEMLHDIHHNNNFVVSRAHSDHPIWTPDQNVNFRIVHDVLGHGQSGGDFSWQGENQACGAHFPLLGSEAQKALFSECIGQTASANYNHGFGPQKTALIQQPFMQSFSAMPEGGFCHRHIRHGIYGLEDQARTTSMAHIFNTPAPPPKSQKLGNTTLEWEQTDKGAVMRITGDTHEDRALGRLVLASELARAGIELAQIPMDHDPKEPLGEELARIAGLHKEADWDEIQQKAKRLLDAGNVTLLRNGYNNVVTKVQGDHGTYDNEISRDDPNSRAITGWQCSCPWDDYSFGRTRQWKKYEARPCAHTLASYWKSVSSPLDPDVDPKIRHVAPGTLPTQGEPGGGQGMGPGGETQPSFPGMTEREGQPPEPQPGDQTSLFDQAIQRTPSLQNALQALDQAAQPEDAGIIPPNPNLELPEQPQTPQPGQLAPGEVPPPNTISAPGARPITIQNPVQIPSTLSSWQEDNWKISDDEPTNSAFQSGDAVRLEEPTYGVAQGKSEEHGAGGWQQIPKNSIGEVRGQDPTTGWVEAHFPLNDSGPMEPYAVKMFLDPSQVSTVNNRSPFVKRR